MVTLEIQDTTAQDPKMVFINDTWAMLVEWHAYSYHLALQLDIEVRKNE